MYIILSQRPIKEFLNANDHKQYMKDCIYFSLKYVEFKKTSKNAFYSIDSWVELYNLFDNTPLYIGILTDKYFYAHCKDTINSIHFTKWHIPKYFTEENKEKVLPPQDRLWIDEEYFSNIWENKIKTNNFNQNPFIEIKLDGK